MVFGLSESGACRIIDKKRKHSVLIVAAFLVLFSLFVFAISTGVLTVTGDAEFQKNIQVDGVITGKSNAQIGEGIDFLDINSLRRYSTYIQLTNQVTTRDIPDDLNGIFVFENATTLSPFTISWIFWDSVTERPSFLVQDGFVGRASIFERSLIIGKEKGSADLNLNYNICSSSLTLADCDTPLTGADLIVEDDIENFGSIQSHENLIVDGNTLVNLFYGSMFQFEESTVVTIAVQGVDVNVTDFNMSLSNGFTFFNTEALIADQNGNYLGNWSISISNGNKRNFRAGIALNDTLQISSASSADSQASIITNISGTGIINIIEGDVVTFTIANLDSTEDVTVEYANLSLVRIGS